VNRGWYPDPSGDQNSRYWDGVAWTPYVVGVETTSADPVDSTWSPPAPGERPRELVSPEPKSSSLLNNVIAQGATVVTLLGALVFACGACVFFLRLWLRGLPVALVVGQLPHNLLITTGLPEVFLPAALGGAGVATLCRQSSWQSDSFWRVMGVVVAGSAIVTGAAAVTYGRAAGTLYSNVLVRSEAWFLVATFGGTLLFLAAAAAYSLRSVHSHRRLAASGIFMLALIPGVAAIWAASPLPAVWVCRERGSLPQFVNGNLVGSSGGNDYIIQFSSTELLGPGPAGRNRWITVVPENQVRLTTLAVGRNEPQTFVCPTTVVPDVVGMTPDQATSLLSFVALGDTMSIRHTGSRTAAVIATVPAFGASIAPGGVVHLVVSGS
jgi:hypothetical protein